MGSVVLDAVNSLFGHPSSHSHSAYPPHETSYVPTQRPPSIRRGRSISSSSTPMSAPGQRAPSSTTTHSNDYSSRPHTPRATPGASQHHAPSPSISSLGTSSAPSSGDDTPGSGATGGSTTATTSSARQSRPRKIKVRDLEHIQSFATEDVGAFSELQSRSRSRSRGPTDDNPQYEISEMKVEHIIEMVAGLLTKITHTNDQQHEHLHRQSHLESASHLTAQTSSVLAFHGKNVPSITILSYLSRINKYCPTSYEVFLSLLVYFDRMTERVNAGPMQSLRQASQHSMKSPQSPHSSNESLDSDGMEGVTATNPQGTQTATPPSSGRFEHAKEQGVPGTPHSRPQDDSRLLPEPSLDVYNLSHFFVVDSFNIHRLVIAGVTCASKFFSDIFYTNSRYAKVGGLPLPELNHLELQFLLLNDFRLSVPVEEIEAYGTMLVEFYAREVVAQQRAQAEATMSMRSLSASSSDSTATVQATG
nr:pho85 cyclin-6 [Quercus suber]